MGIIEKMNKVLQKNEDWNVKSYIPVFKWLESFICSSPSLNVRG